MKTWKTQEIKKKVRDSKEKQTKKIVRDRKRQKGEIKKGRKK